MRKKITLDREKRAVINAFHKEGLSVREIANKMKIPKSTVQDTINRFRKTASNNDRKRTGRPKITTASEDRVITLISKRDRRKTAVEIQADFNRGCDKNVSASTIKRRLRNTGLFGRVAVSKPLLRRGNKLKRLRWAQEHKNWTVDDFKKVLWTDESKFEIFGSKRRTFVRRKTSEQMLPCCLVPTVKHGGGSVMVWGCFSFALSGVGPLHKIEGTLDKHSYHNILRNIAIPAGLSLVGKEFVFQQDNDPKHSSKLCQSYLQKKEASGKLKIMQWPPKSPDLNLLTR